MSFAEQSVVSHLSPTTSAKLLIPLSTVPHPTTNFAKRSVHILPPTTTSAKPLASRGKLHTQVALQKARALFREWQFGNISQNAPRELSPTILSVRKRLISSVSKSVWAQRTRVLNMAAKEMKIGATNLPHNMEFFEEAVMVGLERKICSGHIGFSTALTYGAQAASLRKKTGGSVTALADYLRALRKQGALRPQTQALPMPQRFLRNLLHTQTIPLDVRTGLFIAWKTSSRWDEVQRLKPSALVMRLHFLQIMVNFGGETKSSATHPFAPYLVAMIDWNDAESTKPTKDILQRLMTWKNGALTACSTKQLEAILRKPQFLPHPAWIAEQRKLSNVKTLPVFTAHSLKRGAQVHLWRAVAEGKLNLNLVPRIGKHQTQMEIPQESIRYGQSCLPIIAEALQTHLASRIL